MNIQAFTTGSVQITKRWLHGGEHAYPKRLMHTLLDPHLTDPLPIWCFVLHHPEGLIVIDTGIPRDANKPVWFPPHMRLAQRAAPFQIGTQMEEIGPQLRAKMIRPEDVRWVVLTHLHQDHEGGLHHFPNAEFLVARAEWEVATGWKGRMGGYLNFRWPPGFAPTLVDFVEPDADFGGRHTLTAASDVFLVPTPGHSAGHLSVIVAEDDQSVFFAGDASYTQEQLLADELDGVSPDGAAVHQTHQRIQAFAARQPTVYLPSHEWAVQERLASRTAIRV